MTFGSLFAGIGGFDLGFERAGMTCKWQVEIDPYCNKVLEKHWPNVRRHDDVRTFPPTDADDWRVDVICGGFPCQDISIAGNGEGVTGSRSGLWFEYLRVIRALRPRVAVVENVAAILIRGIDAVLGGLAEIGFDAEWGMFSACEFGAIHPRERLFLAAYSDQKRRFIAGSSSDRQHEVHNGFWNGKATPSSAEWRDVQRWISETFQDGHWECPATAIHRMDDGLPDWVDRNGLVGNAVVPQVAEWIGRRIVEAEPQRQEDNQSACFIPRA